MEYKYKYDCLKGLEPAEFFYWFGEITAIPRESGNEQGMIEFITKYAKERGYKYDVDASGNIFMNIPATPGYENQPMVLFQSHMDVVAAVDEGVEFNYATDSIQIRKEDDAIYSCGTTLGADNGVGIATMLALADELYGPQIPHPPLEFLFTVEEETGLHGIRKFDCSKIKSRRMINMDCGDSHLVCISTAGNIAGKIEKKYEMNSLDTDKVLLEVKLFGGLGGHSGMVANKNRACARNSMGELIVGIFESGNEAELCFIESAGKAVCTEVKAIIAVSADKEDAVKQALEKRFELIKLIYNPYDPNLSMSIKKTNEDEITKSLAPCETEKIGRILSMLRTGQHRNDTVNFATVISSGGIHEALFNQSGEFSLHYSTRSSSNADQELMFEKYVFIAKMLDMKLEEVDRYSGWPANENSNFVPKFSKAYKELYNKDIAVQKTHGCVEIGEIVIRIPDMDAAGYAPTSTGAHTTKEHLFIDEVKTYWDVIKKVMAEKE